MNQNEFLTECGYAKLTEADLLDLRASKAEDFNDLMQRAAALGVRRLYDNVVELLPAGDSKPVLFVERERDTGHWMRQVYVSREEHAIMSAASTYKITNYQLVGLHLLPPRTRQK